jgi:hypothetical protein
MPLIPRLDNSVFETGVHALLLLRQFYSKY